MNFRYTVHLYDTASEMKEIHTFYGISAKNHQSAIRFGMKLWKLMNGRIDMVAFSATEIQETRQPISTVESYTIC